MTIVLAVRAVNPIGANRLDSNEDSDSSIPRIFMVSIQRDKRQQSPIRHDREWSPAFIQNSDDRRSISYLYLLLLNHLSATWHDKYRITG